MSLIQIRSTASRAHWRRRGPVAHARLPSCRLRRPYLPGHARHRRSRRSGRTHAADRQLGSQQFRRRARVGRELQLDQDDHPGPQRGDRLRTDMGAPGRLRLERARHRAAVAGALHPRRRVHVQGWLRRILGWNRHGNARRDPAGKTLTLHWSTLVSASERCRQSLKYLRPFAITGEFSTSTPGQDYTNGSPNVSTFNWGFTLQYSLPYFNTQLAADRQRLPQASDPGRRVRLPDPDLQRSGRRDRRPTGYFQPGVIYEADKWQIALEAMVPMTGATGHGVGVIGSLDFYLDDIPNRIDEPIFPHGLGIAPGI